MTIRLKVRVTSSGLVYNSKKALRSTMRRAGAEVKAAAVRKIKRSAGAGRIYYVRGSGGSGGLGRYQASAPGQSPTSVTGKLAANIKVYPFKDGEGVAIRDRQFYALFLENGAKGGGGKKGNRNRRGRPSSVRQLLPRPFLTAALAEREASISKRIYAAVSQDIAFKRER
jgi:hypothetical protein